LTGIFGGSWCFTENFVVFSASNIFGGIKLNTVRWVGHVTGLGRRERCRVKLGKLVGKSKAHGGRKG